MLLGIPGDNTYSNYAEANRAFYRQTVLPLLARVLAGVSNWLAPAYPGEISLEADLDQVPALAAERDQLWKRISEASFLSDDEKREAVGYDAAVLASGTRCAKPALEPAG
jgi:phage portal protein BeeE